MKSRFVCQNCGAASLKWLGRCPGCAEFNTMVEELVPVQRSDVSFQAAVPVLLSKIPIHQERRRLIGCPELDRVFGGGLVEGSLILLGGDPGIGKSTLMLQIANFLGQKSGDVLYVSGEESAYQVRLRAERLKINGDKITFLSETELDPILQTAAELKPALMIIDSIQTIYQSSLSSAPGSVAQVRECGNRLMQYAKEQGVITVLIGHVTKLGVIAGPKTLEHIVDTVLYFEGDKNQQYRILRAVKNRFGSTNEIAVFEMTTSGLKEVPNPSNIFISDSRSSGSAIVSILEGSRPLLVEVQALTSPSFFNYPQRVTTGIDSKRLAMLLAILERRAGINAYNLDCFVNVVGGIKVSETATDLGIILAIASAIRNKPVNKETLIIGEVGLGGEVRPVYAVDARLKEASSLGLKRAIIPAKSTIPQEIKIDVAAVTEVNEAVEMTLA